MQAIKLNFLPPQQPVDLGIIRNFKINYHHRVIETFLILIRQNKILKITLGMAFMLRQMNGLTIEHEHTASELRQALMATPAVPVCNEHQLAFVRPLTIQMPATVTLPIVTPLPRLEGKDVPEDIKVNRVLRQMHPQLQYLAAGSTYPSLEALADGTDA
ncbi:hypothetical protein HPB52_022531 [Rhipicephalus sanguineus]|uniref:Uncharacterized protein n=1 Tax=Rhipicephalus sanguineus TaxID=34632 RepID=A0A9D4PYX1_RHISA|nr:hypothetical protein HPB52_022531 [Rhipicephalus sanguineus]